MKSRSTLLVSLSLIVLVAMVLGACQPAPAPTEAPPAVPAEPAATEAPPAEPVGCGEEGTIVIAYDGDIDHIEPMQFRSIAAYDATANLYEPLVQQELIDQGDNVYIGSDKYIGAGAESFEVSDDGMTYTVLSPPRCHVRRWNAGHGQ